jgi:RHO1 GDP-GTP exchange protein 1/2
LPDIFAKKCSRHTERQDDSPRLDLKHFLKRPSEHFQKYPVLLEAIYHATAEGNPDADHLMDAVQAIKNLHNVAQLKTFQSAMCRGPTAKWEWADLVDPEFRKSLVKKESKRQA